MSAKNVQRAFILPLIAGLVFQGCAPQTDGPDPITNPQTLGNVASSVVDSVCTNQGDVDSDRDGICDKAEALNPKLGPACVGKPDCNGNGVKDGDDDEGFWDSPWSYVVVGLGATALAAGAVCLVGDLDCNPFNNKDAPKPSASNLAVAPSLSVPTEAPQKESGLRFEHDSYFDSKGALTKIFLKVSFGSTQGINVLYAGQTANLGGTASICIRGRSAVPLDKVGTTSALFQLQMDKVEKPSNGALTKDACFQSNDPGVWVGTSNDSIKMNAIGIGFVKSSTSPLYIANPVTAVVDTTNKKIQFTDPNNSNNSSGIYSYQGNVESDGYLSKAFGKCGDNTCKIMTLLGAAKVYDGTSEIAFPGLGYSILQ
jgi:hypothetical protein